MTVLDRFRLDGKRALVTGGSRGLGRAMALAMAEAGADLVLIGRDPASLERAAGEIRDRGREAWTLSADLADPATCEAACRRTLADPGRIDILVNNVGGRDLDIAIEETDLATWQHFVDLNLTHAFLCTRMIGGAMLTHGDGGRIINLASISGMVANRGVGGRHYEATKAALIHFTRATAAVAQATAAVVQANLAEIGIDVQINALDEGAYWAYGENDASKDLELVLVEYRGKFDPGFQTQWFTADRIGKWNWQRWNSPEFDTLHRDGLVTVDPEKRTQIYIDAQKLMDESAAFWWITHNAYSFAARDWLEPSLLPNGNNWPRACARRSVGAAARLALLHQ